MESLMEEGSKLSAEELPVEQVMERTSMNSDAVQLNASPAPISQAPGSRKPTSIISRDGKRRTSPRARARSPKTASKRPASIVATNRFDDTISSMLNRRGTFTPAANSSPVLEPPVQPRHSVEATIPGKDDPPPVPPLPDDDVLPPPLRTELSSMNANYIPDLADGIRDVEEIRAAQSPVAVEHSPAGSEDRFSWTAPPDQPDDDYGDWRHVKPIINGNVGKKYGMEEEASDESASDESSLGSEGDDESVRDFEGDIERAMNERIAVIESLEARHLAEVAGGVSNVSNVPDQGTPSDRLLPAAEELPLEEETDKPLREGPSEARFAKDGFCSCSRFTVLTKADFVLLAEAESAAARNVPFKRWNHVRELVQKVKKQPRHEPSIYYWLTTLTNFTSWLTLTSRRTEKNRIDNTFFFTTFRYRVKIAILNLSKQRLDRQQAAYRDRPPEVEKQKKVEARLANVHQKRERMNNLKSRQAKIGWTAATSEFSDESEPELDPDETEDTPEDHDELQTSQEQPPTAPTSPVVGNDHAMQLPLDMHAEGPSTSPAMNTAASQPVAAQAATAAASAPVTLKVPKTAARDRVSDAVSNWIKTDSPRTPLTTNKPLKKPKTSKEPKEPKKTKKFRKRKTLPTTELQVEPETKADPSDSTSAATDVEKPPVEPITSVFIVIGWFPDDLHEPNEIYVRVDNVEHFLPELKMHITALRGWRAFLSFKSVQGFGLYKCRISHFAHAHRPTTKDERVTLAHFFSAANRSYLHALERKDKDSAPVSFTHGRSAWSRFRRKLQKIRSERRDAHFLKRTDSRAWAEWVHITMNEGCECPFESQLSLKLILDWSQRRIAIAALIPLALSLGVGLYYMCTNNGVEGTATAWTISSYIVTAGAFIIALIAILTALKDGQTSTFPKPKMSDESAV